MTEVLVPLTVFASITAIVIFIASRRHNERMEMIKRGINPVRLAPPKTGGKTLLFGLICIAVGLALLISVLSTGFARTDHDTLSIALMFLLGGVSLLVYWKLTAGDRERALRAYERHLAEEQSQDQTLNTRTSDTGKAASLGAEK